MPSNFAEDAEEKDNGPKIDESGSTHSKGASGPKIDEGRTAGSSPSRSRFANIKDRLRQAGTAVKSQASKDLKGLGPRKTLSEAEMKQATANMETRTKFLRARAKLAEARGDRVSKITRALAPTGNNRSVIPFGQGPGAFYGMGGGRRIGGMGMGKMGGGGGRLPNPNALYGLDSYGGGGRGRRSEPDMGGLGFSMQPPEDFFGMSSFGGGGGGGGGSVKRGRGRPRKNQSQPRGNGGGGDPMRDFYGF